MGPTCGRVVTGSDPESGPALGVSLERDELHHFY